MEEAAPTALTVQMVENPSDYRLDVRFDRDRLDVMIFNPREDNSLIYRRLKLTPDRDGSVLSSLESTVYDNPLLLSDFSKITVVTASESFAVIPADFNADQAAQLTESPLLTPLGRLKAQIAFSVDPGIYGFFNRAFVNPEFTHTLAPLTRYFSDSRRHGNTTSMFANVESDRLEVIVFDRHRLTLANIYRFRAISDAVYIILSLRKILGMDSDSDEILLSGDRDSRMAVIKSLREFIPYAMPVIFPSAMFRLGRQAVDAPFDLSVLSLCE